MQAGPRPIRQPRKSGAVSMFAFAMQTCSRLWCAGIMRSSSGIVLPLQNMRLLLIFLFILLAAFAHAGPAEYAIRAGAVALLLVTHQLIISSVTGVFPASGEVVVVAPDRKGVKVIGTIKPETIPSARA